MAEEKYIQITAYDKYQLYHDRHMPWFKWHTDCLQSYDLMSLNPAQRWIFVGLMCLATKSRNCIKYDIKYIQSTLKVRNLEKTCLLLVQRGMIQIVYKDSILIREDKIREEKKREEIQKEIKSSLSR
jgi:hypothetical protein